MLPRLLASIAICCLVLPGCISSAPPAPPVRLFDCGARLQPLANAAEPLLAPPQVVSGTGLGAEFAVRTGAHELRLDSEHRWLMPPEQMVEAALRRGLYVDGPCTVGVGAGPLVTLQQFEFDLTGKPLARIELQTVLGGRERVFRSEVAAAAGEAAALVAAMSQAMTEALTALRAALLPQ